MLLVHSFCHKKFFMYFRETQDRSTPLKKTKALLLIQKEILPGIPVILMINLQKKHQTQPIVP